MRATDDSQGIYIGDNMAIQMREYSGLLGGLLWLASWGASAIVALGSAEWGWTFLVLGLTGPIAGAAAGLLWGNWVPFLLGAVGWLLISFAPDPLATHQVTPPSRPRRPCFRYQQILDVQQRQYEIDANAIISGM